jgi:hypothetical protein
MGAKKFLTSGCLIGMLGACAGDAPADDPGGVPLAAALTTSTLTMKIDTSTPGDDIPIPDKFVGLSTPRDYIAGVPPMTPMFRYDANANPYFAHLENLVKQIGVRHIRLNSSDVSDNNPADPTHAQDDDFFQFTKDVGMPPNSVIYSFHPFGDTEDTARGIHNLDRSAYVWQNHADRVEHFAMGNEEDGHPYYDAADGTPGYRTEWKNHYDAIMQNLRALGAAPGNIVWAGPDTTSTDPIWSNPNLVGRAGSLPWTAQFSIDMSNAGVNFGLGTQHYYGANNRDLPDWSSGDTYHPGDRVRDSGESHCWVFEAKTDFVAHVEPTNGNFGQSSPYWKRWPDVWDGTVTYQKGDLVQSPNASCNDKDEAHYWPYQCITDTCTAGGGPVSDTTQWALDSKVGYRSAWQMRFMLLEDETVKYQGTWNNTKGDMPNNIDFRMTEANSYSSGDDIDQRMFGEALWGLNFFHWWARRGIRGVDPFTYLSHYNSPIYMAKKDDPLGIPEREYYAQPYAYGMLAFNLGTRTAGGPGNTLPESDVSWSTQPDSWLDFYEVKAGNHLLVTLINKSYGKYEGQPHQANITIAAKNSSWKIASARKITLESAPGVSGDPLVPTAVLGGATLDPTTSTFGGSWTNIPVAAGSDTLPEQMIKSTTAVVIDITLQ